MITVRNHQYISVQSDKRKVLSVPRGVCVPHFRVYPSIYDTYVPGYPVRTYTRHIPGTRIISDVIVLHINIRRYNCCCRGLHLQYHSRWCTGITSCMFILARMFVRFSMLYLRGTLNPQGKLRKFSWPG